MNKSNSPDEEVPWIDLETAAPLFGMRFATLKNQISMNTFPCPTYKLGRRRVIDRAVLAAFFEKQKADGLRRLDEDPKVTKIRRPA